MKVKINIEKCIGCGTCSALFPEIFELADDFKARLKPGIDLDNSEIKKAIHEAAEACPVGAISIDE